MNDPIIVNLQDKNLPISIGRKAANLQLLLNHGFQIPQTLIIPWEVFERYKANDETLIPELHSALKKVVDGTSLYAVRSSANIEDNLHHSFAGQFKTVLNVKGVDNIIFSTWSIWATTDSPAVLKYLENMPEISNDLKMAVIVQKMVNPVYSGVAFSRNPMTGTDEIVIEAVQGDGLKLVQSGTTPHRWIYKWGKWITQPEEKMIPLAVIQQVVDGTKRIVKALKKPVDLEWVFDGQSIVWVQVRDITTLKNLSIYSNRISKEMMPGQIQPLIWSINIPLIIPIWINLLNEMVGQTHLKPEDLAKQFYHRSYFNMGALGKVFNQAGLPSEGLEMMLGMVPKEAGRPVMQMNRGMLRLAPRLLRFFYRKWNLSRRYRKEFPALVEEIKTIKIENISDLPPEELINVIERLFSIVQKIVFYNVHVPLLLSMYGGLFVAQLRKRGIQPEQFNFAQGMKELDQYNPNIRLHQLHLLYQSLDPSIQSQITCASYDQFLEMEGIPEFKQQVQEFINQYGHLSNNNNNFSAVPWREQPELILRMICTYPVEFEEMKVLLDFAQIKKKSPTLRLFYQRAREFRGYRDFVGDTYTYGYGLFRPYFLAIAKTFVERGWLEEGNDIFFLEWSEIKAAAQSTSDQIDILKIVSSRKIEMQKSQGVELPSVIFGDQLPPIFPANASVMHGTPTSPGYYTGPACLVRGIEDFEKVKPGDVLVIPFSDVGWTPLFARAGAVIAESGGILSHSSIIAREYGIPAVVSVPDAMKLRDNQTITVDGYKGEIILSE